MSLSVALIEALEAEGMEPEAIIRVLKVAGKKSDPTNAERQARHRAKRKGGKDNARYSNGVTPPNERDNLTPREASEAEASLPRPWALWPGVSLQVWTDLMTNRKRKRLPNTETAWVKFCGDAKSMSAQTGIPPPELIRLCVAKGWGAIYDPRDENDRRTNTLGRHQPADGLSSTARAALQVFGR